jgi:hypothetical protein
MRAQAPAGGQAQCQKPNLAEWKGGRDSLMFDGKLPEH